MKKVMTVVLGAPALALGPWVVRAFNPQPEPPAFKMVGLARTQTAVLNVVATNPPGDTRTACRRGLSFVILEPVPPEARTDHGPGSACPSQSDVYSPAPGRSS
jgi:hypothetical protein